MNIRFCKTQEARKLQEFIDKYWAKDHILSRNLDLLMFQHHDKVNDRLNFVVADHAGEFVAILGFIPAYQFDPALSAEPDIWLAIWKKADIINEKGIGMMLYDFLIGELKPRSVAAIGINDTIRRKYEKMGFDTGELDHVFYPRGGYNPPDWMRDKKIMGYYETADYIIEQTNEILTHNCIPQKTETYYRNRYLNHPFYEYQVFSIKEMDNTVKIQIIVRRIELNFSACLRIVDIPYYAYQAKTEYDYFRMFRVFKQLLREEWCEYIDFVGLHYKFVQDSHFIRAEDPFIIPNYFEPFVAKNITLQYAVKNMSGQNNKINVRDYLIFKGDSDQDRPNILP